MMSILKKVKTSEAQLRDNPGLAMLQLWLNSPIRKSTKLSRTIVRLYRFWRRNYLRGRILLSMWLNNIARKILEISIRNQDWVKRQPEIMDGTKFLSEEETQQFISFKR